MRVGEVGGSLPGFFGGVFSPDGMALLAHGYQGAFQLWRYQEVCSWVVIVCQIIVGATSCV